MNLKSLLILLLLVGYQTAKAQNEYIVSTSTSKNIPTSEEEQFVNTNFELYTLCKWVPELKFMFLPEDKDRFLPILKTYEDKKDVASNILKQKILEFVGTEESEEETYAGKSYSTRFIFSCEGNKYYYEFKNKKLDELCSSNPRASINGLVFLRDVDKAKELLIGKTLYTKTTSVRVDDTNSYKGYSDANIPFNTKVTIKAVGVGNKQYPVKLIFEDEKGHSYYTEVAFSRTNSGMDKSDFQADKKVKYFPNAFSFVDQNEKALDDIKSKYINLPVYPKKNIEAEVRTGSQDQPITTRIRLARYTQLTIKDMKLKSGKTLVTLMLEDANGNIYLTDVDLKYDYIIKNENYIEDLFAFGNIRSKYPNITEEHWALIAYGEVKPGMNTDECRLALGEPSQIIVKKDSKFETWLYHGYVLEFESGILIR